MASSKNGFEYMLNGAFPGREHVMFFFPWPDLSSYAWGLGPYWDVKRQWDGMVIVEHPDLELWESQRPDYVQAHRSKFVMELPAFTKVVATAHEERLAEYGGRIGAGPSLPMLVTDVHRLRDYYIEVGAYASDAPTPALPPPPYPKAEIGKEYAYELFSDCALFDGRFWIAAPPLHAGDGGLLTELENSTVKGVMALKRVDAAVFTAASGHSARFVPLPPEIEQVYDACG